MYPKLSYQIQGAMIEVRKQYGPGHKEVLYQRAFADELTFKKIKFEKEKRINIYSHRTNKIIGFYQPDFIIDGKIIIEIKALPTIPRKLIDQLYDYLRNSDYELGKELFTQISINPIDTNNHQELSGTSRLY